MPLEVCAHFVFVGQNQNLARPIKLKYWACEMHIRLASDAMN